MNDKEINRYIGMKIKEFRKEKKLTQKELADLVGIKNSAISNYEQGVRIPKRDFLFKVANSLNVSIDELFPNQNEVIPSSTLKENSQIRLKKIMDEQGLRQVDILEKSKPFQDKLGIKMSKTHLSNYINGKSNPDQQKLILLSQTLGVSEPWLMGYDVPRNVTDGENSLIEKTIKNMKKLSEQRQNNVLQFSKNQLEEQNHEVEKEKILALDKIDSNENDTNDDGIDWNEWVAFDGKPMTDHDKQVLKDYFGDELKD
ncbi:helix-turn-helix domain-containing protein [Lactococcus lactis]|uniref:helix-turn-helix domain-containing protein n=1 Tax=Lactococcus lactis TaxID=1358 RepID=UPI001F57FA80|nr:helix-turn-helix domain-containing protein [Lactococcus lactis]